MRYKHNRRPSLRSPTQNSKTLAWVLRFQPRLQFRTPKQSYLSCLVLLEAVVFVYHHSQRRLKRASNSNAMLAENLYERLTIVTGGKNDRFAQKPEAHRDRKHLFLDIQPYTCLYASCSFCSNPFANRQLWSSHLELDHKFGPNWDAVECPLCFQSTESGKSSILIHFARHMEDIALAALPCEVESDAESEDEDEDDYRTHV